MLQQRYGVFAADGRFHQKSLGLHQGVVNTRAIGRGRAHPFCKPPRGSVFNRSVRGLINQLPFFFVVVVVVVTTRGRNGYRALLKCSEEDIVEEATPWLLQ